MKEVSYISIMQFCNRHCYRLIMKRNVLLYIVDIFLFIFSLIVVVSGVIKFPGLLTLLNFDPFSLPQSEITFLHDWIGIALTVLTMVHILLNWKWIMAMSKKLLNRRIIKLVFIGIISIAGIAVIINNNPRNARENLISTDQIIKSTNEINRGDLNKLEDTQAVEMNKILIDGIGTFEFNPKDISSIRNDVFKKGFFSVFDVLVHLSETGQINLSYEFSKEHETYIIRDINGLEDWWYVAFYDGGWPENNAWRMDLFPYKDRASIQIKQIEIDRIQAIYASFAEEVLRKELDNGRIIIPKVIIKGKNSAQIFENVDVTSHNLRHDYFQEGTITAIDVILSMSDSRSITHQLNWYESIGSAGLVKNYFVDEINGDESRGRCGFVYELGEDLFTGFRGNHIHVPSDLRVLQTTPTYVEFFWICI